ncbi:MAG TPA: PfkB family carbohydrate kinase [Solirubrobacteraceae bacterium]
MRFDYVTVGHVTVDVIAREDGPSDLRDGATGEHRQPGGGAFYSALQAARLGLRTLIVTRGVAEELQPLLAPYAPELQVEILPAAHTTTLLTRGRGRRRSQRLLAWAGPFDEPLALDTEILHLAPIARETPRSWGGPVSFVGLTPQGLVRGWGGGGEIGKADLARERIPAHCDAVVFSAEESGRCAELPALAGNPIVAITAGARPTTVLGETDAPIDVATCEVPLIRDDLGAGDVFAAAFFVALHDGLPPERAAEFGNAAAAVRIAGAGPDAIGDRKAIEHMAARGSRSAER